MADLIASLLKVWRTLRLSRADRLLAKAAMIYLANGETKNGIAAYTVLRRQALSEGEQNGG